MEGLSVTNAASSDFLVECFLMECFLVDCFLVVG